MDGTGKSTEKTALSPEQDIRNGAVTIGGVEIPFSERVVKGRLKVMLPTEYEQMEKRHVKVKYPVYRNKDIFVLTNKDTTINFMFDFKNVAAEPDRLEEIRDQLLGVLKKAHPSLVLLDKSTIGSEGAKVAYFEIVTPALDKDIYNFMYFFLVDENLVIASFNCYDDEKAPWRPIIRQVAESLRATLK